MTGSLKKRQLPSVRIALGFTLLLSAVLSAGWSTPACANSIFSMFFFGERIPHGDSRSRGMGLSDLSQPDASSALTGNPARLAYLDRTTLSAVGVIGGNKASDDVREYQSGFSEFTAIALALPLSGNFVLSAGYQLTHDAEGEFFVPQVTTVGDPYRQRFTKAGSLFEIPLSVSWKWRDRLVVGASYLIQRGTVKEIWDLDFEEPGFITGTTEYEESFDGETVALGLQVRPLPAVTFSALYRPGYDSDVVVRQRFSTSASDSTFERKDHFPALLGGGLGLSLGDYWVVTAEYLEQDWREYSGRRFWMPKTEKEITVRFGVERAAGLVTDSLLERFPIRVGYSFSRWPISEPEGEPIIQHTFTVGSGFLLGGNLGNLDYSLEFAKIGAIDKNSLTENQFRFSIGISGGETWK